MTNGPEERNRPPLFALALVVLALGAGVWFLRPICVAGTCFGEEAAAVGSDPARAVSVSSLEAPRREGDTETPLRLPMPSAASPAVPEPIGREPAGASTEGVTRTPAYSSDEGLFEDGAERDPLDPGPAAETQPGADMVEAEALAALAETALWDPDERRRGEAIHAIGLQRHKGDALTVLIDVATMDWDPANRYRALRSLWSAAADGLDSDGSIDALLEELRWDADPELATLAAQAQADLDALETRRARQGQD